MAAPVKGRDVYGRIADALHPINNEKYHQTGGKTCCTED